MMKKNAVIFIILICFVSARAQEITEKHFDFTGKGSVEMNIQIADSINLHAWNKNEVFVKASVSINDNKDNEGYVISFEETGNSLVISGKIKENYFKERNNNCTVTDIYWKIYVPERVAFSIETINGNITIDGITGKIRAKSINGFIDLAAPSDRKADIKFSTITGTIYTDHKLVSEWHPTGIPSVIREDFNKGGSPVTLETISGDIYFRRSD
jgi:hypothetical protein